MLDKKNTKISFTQDILKEVAKELGISEGKVKSIYDTQIIFLRYLIDKTDAVAIYIPYIGTLHIKLGYVYKQIERYSKDIKHVDKLNIFKKKKEILDAHLQLLIKNKYKGKSRHLEKNKLNRFTYNAGKTIDEIEDIQNNR